MSLTSDQMFSLAQLTLGGAIALASAYLTNWFSFRRAERVEKDARLRNEAGLAKVCLGSLWRIHLVAAGIYDTISRQAQQFDGTEAGDMPLCQRVTGVVGIEHVGPPISLPDIAFILETGSPDLFFQIARLEMTIKILVDATIVYGERRDALNDRLQSVKRDHFDPKRGVSTVKLDEHTKAVVDRETMRLDSEATKLLEVALEASVESKVVFEQFLFCTKSHFKDRFPELGVLWTESSKSESKVD